MRVRVAWVLAGVTCVLVVADAVVTAQYWNLFSEAAVAVHGFPFVNGAVLGCSVMGALIISRAERHPVGWLLSLIGVTSAFSLLAESYSFWVVTEGGPGPHSLGGVSGWFSTLFGGQLAIGGLALLFLLAPDGHFLSRRWRWAALVIVSGALFFLAALLSVDPREFEIVAESDDAGSLRNVLLSIGLLLIVAGLVASLASMLLRLRRSQGEQRQQVLLIAAAAALVTLGLVNLLVVQIFNGGEQTWAAALPLFTAYLLLPILFAVAVLRYRLYDIEVIINGAVVLVLGTAFAALGYTTLVVAVGHQVGRQTGGFWLSLLATALVALAFQPLRRRVVRLANRLAYGSRAQPYEALSDFSGRLADTPSPTTLLPSVAEAAGRALSAPRATATLDVPGAEPVSATWGQDRTEPTSLQVVPVRTDGATLGSIAVSIPKGHPLRSSDLRLLAALADQTAIAFRNSALEIRLAEHVAELDRTTRELARSRARIIEADDDARRDLEAAISREVLPHLVALPHELDLVRAELANGMATQRVEELVAGTNAALESLRELTRGVFPTQLARSGIEPALRSLLARSGQRVTLRVDASAAAGRRFSARVEATVYFCCAEAARAVPDLTSVELSVADQDLRLRIRPVPGTAVDLRAIVDRVAAVGGSLSVADDVLTLDIPVGADHPTYALLGRVDPGGGEPGL